MTQKFLFISGCICLLFLGTISLGEFLMMYSPNGGYSISNMHQNFLFPSIERLKLGYFLAVFSAPIYILVYTHISGMLKHSIIFQRIMIALASIGFVVGNVWLGTNAYLGYLVHQTQSELTENTIMFISELSDPLLQVVRISVLSLSLLISYSLFTQKTHYSRWIILVSPFFILLYIFGGYALEIRGFSFLLPAALNIAHLIFMIFSTFYAYKIQKT